MYQVIEITWQDVIHEEARISVECALTFRPVTVRSLGYLLDETDDYYIIGSWLWEGNEKCNENKMQTEHTAVIPKGMVRGVRRLCPES